MDRVDSKKNERLEELRESLTAEVETIQGRKRLVNALLNDLSKVCPNAAEGLILPKNAGTPLDTRRVMAYMNVQVELCNCLLAAIDRATQSEISQIA